MALPLLAAAGGVAAGIWIAKQFASAVGGAVATVRNNIPQLDDQVVVEVQGQPGSSKQELYYLALAAANGVVRRYQPLLVRNPANPPTMAVLGIEYDAADSWVRCTIHYRVGTLGMAIETGARASKDRFDTLQVYRGPQHQIVGGSFDFRSTVLPGVPNEEGPQLPWANRVIVTGCPTVQQPVVAPITQAPAPSENIIPTVGINSPNPKPPGDNRSRGAVYTADPTTSLTSGGANAALGACPKELSLVQLVFSALTDPGSDSNTTWEPPAQGPLGS